MQDNDSYSKTIGTAKVELSLTNGENETVYPMLQTALDAYMVTVFVEPGTYTWADKIDEQNGTLSGEITVEEASAITFFYRVSEQDYTMINTVDDAEDFYDVAGPYVEPEPEVNPFADIAETDWYYKYAKFAVDNNLMSGKDTTEEGLIEFAPTKEMSRAQFVQVLYSKEGKPEVEYKDIFSDVKETDWFADAVIWANENGIAGGSGTVFNAREDINRQEIAMILYKYAQFKGCDVAGAADITGYGDDENVSSWAAVGMQWAVEYGVITGKNDPQDSTIMLLKPKSITKRAEAAAMMRSFMVAYEGVEE